MNTTTFFLNIHNTERKSANKSRINGFILCALLLFMITAPLLSVDASGWLWRSRATPKVKYRREGNNDVALSMPASHTNLDHSLNKTGGNNASGPNITVAPGSALNKKSSIDGFVMVDSDPPPAHASESVGSVTKGVAASVEPVAFQPPKKENVVNPLIPTPSEEKRPTESASENDQEAKNEEFWLQMKASLEVLEAEMRASRAKNKLSALAAPDVKNVNQTPSTENTEVAKSINDITDSIDDPSLQPLSVSKSDSIIQSEPSRSLFAPESADTPHILKSGSHFFGHEHIDDSCASAAKSGSSSRPFSSLRASISKRSLSIRGGMQKANAAKSAIEMKDIGPSSTSPEDVTSLPLSVGQNTGNGSCLKEVEEKTSQNKMIKKPNSDKTCCCCFSF